MNYNKNYTITYDEQVKGWTSFHSFNPEWILGMNNNMFTFKNGELYIHNSDDVPRNTFYGTQYPSKISMMFNDSPSEIKELKGISLEGNYSWDSLITAFVSNIDDNMISSIDSVEFEKKEGIWYAYARRNEDSGQLDSKSAYGIGVVENIAGNTIKIKGFSDLIVSGDSLVKGSNLSVIGKIETSERDGDYTNLTLNSTSGLSIGDFVIGTKNPRIEGGNLRGYTIRVDLEITKNDKVELFAVNNEVIKSNP